MNITRELLEDNGVVSFIISDGKNDYVCAPRKINKNILELSLLAPLKENDISNLFLKILFTDDTGYKSSAIDFSVTENGEDYCIGIVGTSAEPTVSGLFEKFAALEYQDEKYGRRKEDRLQIGKANCKKFGLSTPEQILFARGIKMIQPCAIVDASLHGICVITPYTAELKSLENFNIKLSFITPDETVFLQAHKVHSRLNKTETKVFATLSCQLLEPISFCYKKRVIALSELLRQSESS